MTDLTSLSEQVEALLAMNRDGACIPKVPNLAVTLLEAQSARIRDLERERDEARQKVADAYQVVGTLIHYGGLGGDEMVRALDYFADAEGPSQKGFLPWPASPLEVAEKPEDAPAFKAGMMRAAEIVEEAAHKQGRPECCGCGIQHYGPPECCGDPLFMIADRDAAAAIRTEAKGGRG